MHLPEPPHRERAFRGDRMMARLRDDPLTLALACRILAERDPHLRP